MWRHGVDLVLAPAELQIAGTGAAGGAVVLEREFHVSEKGVKYSKYVSGREVEYIKYVSEKGVNYRGLIY